MTGSVVLAGARTPMGRLKGGLSGLTAVELGGIAIAEALRRAGVPPEKVQYTIMGQVLTAGAGQIPARQAAVAGGIPMDVPALTINKVCLSGLDAIALADQLIRAGEFEVVVAGGQESMTQAPHLLGRSRDGFAYGDVTMVDHMAHDGLFCAFDHMEMGAATEKYNQRYGVTRAEQDAFAVASHQRAAAAAAVLAEEIVPVTVPRRSAPDLVVGTDENVRPDTSVEILSRLRPSFAANGSITAGSSSPISDGAAAVVVCSKGAAERLGVPWMAEIGAHGVVAGPDPSLHEQPANAITAALLKERVTASQLDLVEINEAFAAVGIVSRRKLGLDPEIVNAEGGAIALGHPLGMSGARLVLHLAHALRRRGGGLGAAAMCGGGGQGDALLLRVPLT